MRKALGAAVLAVGFATFAAATTAHNGDSGFKTTQGPMIDPVAAGASYTPIISVGDRLRGGYMFESIPDGISIVSSKPHSRHDDDHDGDKRKGDTTERRQGPWRKEQEPRQR